MLYIIASKRNLKRAVDRNLARRRIRAVLDGLKPGWRKSLTGKVYANPETLTTPLPQLTRQIKALLKL